MCLQKLLFLIVPFLFMLNGCQRIIPVRTLPSWVHGIHVPMVHNGTYEPEIEELLTRLTQEAFLADGRVDIVEEKDSDLVLEIELVDWRAKTVDTSGDDVASDQSYRVVANLKLLEPNSRGVTYAELGRVSARGRFNTDTRSMHFIPEFDRKKRICENLAGVILNKAMTGAPRTIEGNAIRPSGLGSRAGDLDTGQARDHY